MYNTSEIMTLHIVQEYLKCTKGWDLENRQRLVWNSFKISIILWVYVLFFSV